jgi:hypothetical protein
MADEQDPPKRRRDTVLPERIMRRVLEGVGEVVDRGLGRSHDPKAALSTDQVIQRMNRLIDERVRNEKGGRIAPHHLKLKVEWGTHSETPEEVTRRLETEILAAAIDHINDNRYRTMAPMKIETEVDIFTVGIAIDPTFGAFEAELRRQDLELKTDAAAKGRGQKVKQEFAFSARITLPEGSREIPLLFVPGGRRINVGRGTDNDLYLNHTSVSKVHAAVRMNAEGTLMVADTGSTNGTHINGVRIPYGEARPIATGDVVAFGEVEVRFRKADS